MFEDFALQGAHNDDAKAFLYFLSLAILLSYLFNIWQPVSSNLITFPCFDTFVTLNRKVWVHIKHYVVRTC